MPNHEQHAHDDATGPEREPDVYYLVPNKYGPSFVRRRPPPSSTSPPMDDDFDAATTRGANTEWSGPAHRLERPSPLTPDYARATITKASIAGPSTLKPQPVMTAPPRRKDKDEARGANSDVRESRDRELYETHGDYGRIMNELDRKFGTGPDLTLTPTRSRKEQESSGQAVRATTTSTNVNVNANASANTGISRIGYPTRLGSVGRPTGAAVRPPHTFEIVDRRVLESGPERTVTISTWREQVALETDQQANVDIYYLDTQDYAEGRTVRGDDEVEEEETSSVGQVNSPRIRKRSLPLPPPPPLKESTSSGSDSDPGSIIRTITDEQSESAPMSQVRRTPSLDSTSRKSSSHSSRRRRPTSRSSGSNPRPGIWQPTPPQTPPRPLRGPTQDSGRGHSRSPNQPIHALNDSAGGSRSSPGRPVATLPLRRTPDHSRPRTQPTPRSSTPKGVYMRESAPSFHPTQSGSTISTIKSASMIALEQILGSCDPPLLHLVPALASLGIRSDGHLRAIARLSDETRDRELKDAALREGITVMDWAILLDRLQIL